MIQTVKCSPLVDIKLNQGFYYALCTLNLFLCKRKFFSLAAPFRQSYCLLKRHAASKEKYISPVLFEINQ